MRVLLVTHYYPEHGGGIEIAAGELAHRLARHGVLTTWAASDVLPTSRERSLPMRTWNVAERVAGFAFPLWSPASLFRLWSEVGKCDLVHIHEGFYPGSLFACAFARILRKPVVVTQHVGQIPDHASMSFSLRLARWLLALAHRTLGRVVLGTCARCVFISPEVQKHFTQLFSFKREPLYIPNGVDLQVFHPVSGEERLRLRAKLGWPSDKRILLFVGRFIDRKGLPIMRLLAERFPECEWVFIGRGPVDPVNWGLPNVRCQGTVYHSSLGACYQAADLLVLPSVIEGFPLVVQEAMASGTPVLVTGEIAKGCPAVAGTAYICEPTEDQFSYLLRELVTNPAVLEDQRAKVATFARKHWDWDGCTDRYLELFSNILNSTDGDSGCSGRWCERREW